MSKAWILAILLLVFPTTATVASAQNDVQVAHGPIIKRGVSFLQNAPRAAALGPMKPPREADRGRDLIKVLRNSMHGAAPNTNLERARATMNASVVNGGTAVTFNGLDIVDQEFDNRV